MDTKHWMQSKTIIFNVLTAVVTLGTDLAGVLPPNWAAKILAAVALANIALRFITTMAIK